MLTTLLYTEALITTTQNTNNLNSTNAQCANETKYKVDMISLNPFLAAYGSLCTYFHPPITVFIRS